MIIIWFWHGGGGCHRTVITMLMIFWPETEPIWSWMTPIPGWRRVLKVAWTFFKRWESIIIMLRLMLMMKVVVLWWSILLIIILYNVGYGKPKHQSIPGSRVWNSSTQGRPVTCLHDRCPSIPSFVIYLFQNQSLWTSWQVLQWWCSRWWVRQGRDDDFRGEFSDVDCQQLIQVEHQEGLSGMSVVGGLKGF